MSIFVYLPLKITRSRSLFWKIYPTFLSWQAMAANFCEGSTSMLYSVIFSTRWWPSVNWNSLREGGGVRNFTWHFYLGKQWQQISVKALHPCHTVSSSQRDGDLVWTETPWGRGEGSETLPDISILASNGSKFLWRLYIHVIQCHLLNEMVT